MKATLHLPRRATYAEYLAVESTSAHRNELIDGVIVAMAGGSDERNAIAIRAYEKAGFRYFKTIRLPDEDAPEYLMHIIPAELETPNYQEHQIHQAPGRGGGRLDRGLDQGSRSRPARRLAALLSAVRRRDRRARQHAA